MSDLKHVVYGQNNLALGTLGGVNSAITSTKIDSSRAQGVRLSKLKATIGITGKQVGEGPLVAGFCIGDFTSLEVDEAIQADPQEKDDIPDSERANRRLWPVWYVDKSISSTAEIPVSVLKEVDMPWKTIDEGDILQFWVFNSDAVALTTGTIVNLRYAAIGEWLRD